MPQETFRFRLSSRDQTDLSIILDAMKAVDPFATRSQAVRAAVRRMAADVATTTPPAVNGAPA